MISALLKLRVRLYLARAIFKKAEPETRNYKLFRNLPTIWTSSLLWLRKEGLFLPWPSKPLGGATLKKLEPDFGAVLLLAF